MSAVRREVNTFFVLSCSILILLLLAERTRCYRMVEVAEEVRKWDCYSADRAIWLDRRKGFSTAR